MSMHSANDSRLRNILVVIGAIGLGAAVAVATQRPQIPTGGPIPDRRGFQGVNDPRYPDVIKEGVVTRRVAGQVYVIAGAGGNVVVFAGDEGVLLVDNNFSIFWDHIRTAIRQISDPSWTLSKVKSCVYRHLQPRISCSDTSAAGFRW